MSQFFWIEVDGERMTTSSYALFLAFATAVTADGLEFTKGSYWA